MALLQQIENALISINPAVFQELGDAIMMRRQDYHAFLSVGSQYGKQKTIKGTPDTFIHCINNKYILVEYSTNETKRDKKLLEDFEKCLTMNNVNDDEIDAVYLFTNYRLEVEESIHIKNYANRKKVDYEIYDGQRIAKELLFKHRDLVSLYLNLHVDTGQIVPVDTFIKEYDNAAGCISAPLSTEFQFREDELKSILGALENTDFIIIHGMPGVGKTKLALQAIADFCDNHNGFKSFCISNKGGELLTDLQAIINTEDDNILFVDDINRIDFFGQIIGFYHTARTGKLKVIMTVRDYALKQAEQLCGNHEFKSFEISLMSSEEIESIVKKSLGIRNALYLQKICEIAKGNPRIAMMVGRVALRDGDLQSLNDVSELFDKYFSNIFEELEYRDDYLTKCAGIVSFFSPLQIEDGEGNAHLTQVLNDFKVESSVFTDCLNYLNKRELIDLPMNKQYAKVPDQNLGMYFFYKAFVKDKVLDVDTLFHKYYNREYRRNFKDYIIPANNTFGPEKVEGVICPSLTNFYYSISDDGLRFALIQDFFPWLYNQAMAFLYRILESTIQSSSTVISLSYDTNQFVFNRDPYLELCGRIFRMQNEMIASVIDFSLRYVRKRIELAPQLAYQIHQNFCYTIDDSSYSYFRQKTLVDTIINKADENDALANMLLWNVAEFLLGFEYNYNAPSYEKNTYRIHVYRIGADTSILELRRRIWEVLFNHYSESFLSLLNNYTKKSRADSKIAEEDMKYILKIINKYLNPSDFSCCLCVQNYLRWTSKKGMTVPTRKEISRTYRSKEYLFYNRLCWNKLKDKDQYEYNDFNGYFINKQNELKKYFSFKTTRSYKLFFEKFSKLYELSDSDQKGNLLNSLNYISNIAFEQGDEVGCYLLSLIAKYDFPQFIPSSVFYNQLSTSRERADMIFDAFSAFEFRNKSAWILVFYEKLNIKGFQTQDCSNYLDAIATCPKGSIVNIGNVEGYVKCDREFGNKLLGIIISRNENGDNIRIYPSELKMWEISTSEALVEKTYIQQICIYDDINHSFETLKMLFEKRHGFLVDCVESALGKELTPPKKLSFIWGYCDVDGEIEKILEVIRKRYRFRYHVRRDWENALFSNFETPKQKEIAKQFLLKTFSKFIQNKEVAEQTALIARFNFREIYIKIISKYVETISSCQEFFEIDWINRHPGFSYGGDTYLGDLVAARWTEMLDILEKVDNPLKYQIKEEIKIKILHSKKDADDERNQRLIYS